MEIRYRGSIAKVMGFLMMELKYSRTDLGYKFTLFWVKTLDTLNGWIMKNKSYLWKNILIVLSFSDFARHMGTCVWANVWCVWVWCVNVCEWTRVENMCTCLSVMCGFCVAAFVCVWMCDMCVGVHMGRVELHVSQGPPTSNFSLSLTVQVCILQIKLFC